MTGKDVTDAPAARGRVGKRPARPLPTYCDPRLNAEEAIEVAFLIAELLKSERLARGDKEQAAAE